MTFFFLPVILAALPQIDNEAEKLFRAVEAKVGKTETLQLKLEGRIKTKEAEATFKGSLHIGTEARIRSALNMEASGQSAKFLLVCDGAEVVVRAGDKEVSRGKIAANVAEGQRRAMLHLVLRTGYFTGYRILGQLRSSGSDQFADVAKAISVGQFKLGPKETVKGKEAQVIHFHVKVEHSGTKPRQFQCTLWVDLETRLPLQRVLVENQDGAEITTREVYSTFMLNEMIDSKVFKLPM